MENLYKYLLFDSIVWYINMYYNSKYSELDPQVLSLWDCLGFTRGLNGDDCVRMANVFEELAIYLLKHTPSNKPEDLMEEMISDDVSELAFPLARRIYQNHSVILHPRQLTNIIITHLANLRKKHKENKAPDVDAWVIADLSVIIGDRFRGKGV